MGTVIRNPRTGRKGKSKSVKNSLSPLQKQEVHVLVNRTLKKTIERKFGPPQGNLVSMSSTFQVGTIINIPQGTTDYNRIGDKIHLTSLKIQYQIDRNVLNAVYDEYFRVIIFQWNLSSGLSDPASGTIARDVMFLNDPYATAINYRSWYGPDLSTSGAKNFTILYDRTHKAVGLGTATSPNSTNGIMVKRNVSLAQARKTVEFAAGSATSATNSLYWLFVGTTVTNPSSLIYTSQVWFNDA
jgi:hypothetical protein